MTMQVKMRMPAEAVSGKLVAWLKDALPFDITVTQGRSLKGERRVVFTVMGTTQEDIMEKLEALEAIIDDQQGVTIEQ